MNWSLDDHRREAVAALEIVTGATRREAFEAMRLRSGGTLIPRDPNSNWSPNDVHVELYGISASGPTLDQAIRHWVKCAGRTLVEDAA